MMMGYNSPHFNAVAYYNKSKNAHKQGVLDLFPFIKMVFNIEKQKSNGN